MNKEQSPRKLRETRVTVTRFSSYMMEQRENAELHMDLKKTQAENEDLKNVLIGLDLKLHVHNDIKLDLEQHKKMLDQSENAREDL